MAVEYNIPENVISLIAGRLLWDDDFIAKLKDSPREAFRETLEEGDLDPTEELLDALVAEYNSRSKGLQEQSKGYYKEKKPTVI